MGRIFHDVRRGLDGERARMVAIAVLIAVCYYAGSRIGFLLTFPGLTPSVLWPPNAILTATLLLARPSRWPVYLLAAFPAHLAVQLPHAVAEAVPLTLTLMWFATNCSEGIIAATLVRRFADTGQFDSLRAAGVFIVGAGLAAPFLSSFLDAAAVRALRGDDYWLVWRTRFFANALTELSLVPPLMMAIGGGLAWARRQLGRRWLEATALWLVLLTASLMVVYGPDVVAGFVVSPMIPLAFVLPFLLWAAVRLGPAGTSAAILTVEVVAIIAGMRGQGPFAALTPLDNVLSLQIVLIVLAIPLMCLAALLEEHERIRRTMEARLGFEEVLSALSRAFVSLPSHEIDAAIESRLRELGEYFGADHITILQLSPVDTSFMPTHVWMARRYSRVPPGLPEAASWEELTEFPLLVTDVCVLSFGPLTSGRPWPREMVPQLRLVTEVFANAIARKKAEEALRASEHMNTAILGSLTSGVAVLTRDGRVAAMNPAWCRLGFDSEEAGPAAMGVGASSERLCRHALGFGAQLVDEALAGVQSVIDGKCTEYALEYPRPSSSGERWFALSVLPLNRPDGGAVVSLTDVTERRRMDLEAQQTRQELAHFARVSAMGELTASLAHELNQPLTGILANAQAAQRFLNRQPPDLDEVRGGLADIVADDRRAADVIRRLRELLRKGTVRRVPLDLNVLVAEVAKLLGSDAIMRDVSIALDLDPDLLLVRADRVQMQQVILNLLVNAMEAMTGHDASDRLVTVRTKRSADHKVHVAVEDDGRGLAPAITGSMFEPFYTTKADGMGMGLSIARSIILATGGEIWATSNPLRGATFHFTLPLTSDAS